MFEFDPVKSELNSRKHGIDFKTAIRLWEDPNRVVIKAKVVGEKRYLLIAKLERKCWSAIFTLRYGNVRIISVRKSRKNEKEIYNGRGI